ncbi:MAG: apolipoprotein N-acyltransferase [Burkholderiales bacterium]|nr:apolipoprotein N-acyltransferase [Burkholderiales bacterium]OJX07444.1 MAG: hypothetical protein BGO72_08275 [Burkholderiales bacterium 70-64]
MPAPVEPAARLRPVPGAAAALIAGLVHAASFAPLGAWWLQLAAQAVLAALLLRVPAAGGSARGALLGFAFGLGWFTAGVSWVYISMHRYGGMPAPVAALAVVLFAAYLALFPAAVAAATLRARAYAAARGAGDTLSGAPLAGIALLFAGSWGLAEIARGYLFTGFPWLATGYAHVDGPLAGLAPVVGVYGVSACAALVAFGLGTLVHGLTARHAPPAVAPAASPSVVHGRGATRGSAAAMAGALTVAPLVAGLAAGGIDWSHPSGQPLQVRLLQGNVAQEMKFDPARTLEAMRSYVDEVRRAEAALTVLPETAWTLPWSFTPEPLRAALAAHLEHNGGMLAIGMPLPEAAASGRAAPEAGAPDAGARDAGAPVADAPDAGMPRLTNSVAVIGPDGNITARYDKRHLVPFGEFVPRGFGWFVAMMDIPLGEFGRGAAHQPPIAIGDQRVAFDICYEDLFGEELAVQVRDGATILANVSNIAWFGDSLALPQHLQIARMRAIELARPVLRSTNTGVTAAIDAHGRILGRLPVYVADALEASVQGTAGLTPYARAGNAAPLALGIALVLGGAAATRARRRAHGRTR